MYRGRKSLSPNGVWTQVILNLSQMLDHLSRSYKNIRNWILPLSWDFCAKDFPQSQENGFSLEWHRWWMASSEKHCQLSLTSRVDLQWMLHSLHYVMHINKPIVTDSLDDFYADNYKFVMASLTWLWQHHGTSNIKNVKIAKTVDSGIRHFWEHCFE